VVHAKSRAFVEGRAGGCITGSIFIGVDRPVGLAPLLQCCGGGVPVEQCARCCVGMTGTGGVVVMVVVVVVVCWGVRSVGGAMVKRLRSEALRDRGIPKSGVCRLQLARQTGLSICDL